MRKRSALPLDAAEGQQLAKRTRMTKAGPSKYVAVLTHRDGSGGCCCICVVGNKSQQAWACISRSLHHPYDRRATKETQIAQGDADEEDGGDEEDEDEDELDDEYQEKGKKPVKGVRCACLVRRFRRIEGVWCQIILKYWFYQFKLVSSRS